LTHKKAYFHKLVTIRHSNLSIFVCPEIFQLSVNSYQPMSFGNRCDAGNPGTGWWTTCV